MTTLLATIAAAVGVSLAGGQLDGRLPDEARWAAFAETPATSAAPAQQPAPPAPVTSISADVMVLHGTNDNSGIDPQIGKMPALSKPPFSAYNSYKLLERSTVSLPKGKSVPLKLPTGRELLLLFKDVIQPKPADPLRFVIAASIQKPNGKSFLPNVEVNANAGEWFFVGGQDYNGGSLVIGIKVMP